MTESAENPLHPALEPFILTWGDLGGAWGVNRSVSQIHGLLYLSPRPLTAEEIAGALKIARSNVSTSVRELLRAKLIHRVPVKGDRKDHYAAETDIWEMTRRIAEMRKDRELRPAIAALEDGLRDAAADRSVDKTAVARLDALLSFARAVDRWHGEVAKMPKSRLDLLLRIGGKIAAYLPQRWVAQRGAEDDDVGAEAPGK